ncbi:uncharacterized protein si:ch211-250n8.1 isoform X1 [Alosa sapidissima]|uniref:uncharacterized protein si:ch211-250n8.1 isoform X1 n=2 Tax=Alosa sapidissima TaxID=34773 RepID=UPI001C094B40|nr:uncharacterized protein si:ch211-250n8.1 isoform X1 [Alosa sapidissima]
MPPKDPLLETLKVCILNLSQSESPVTDSCPHLSSCCELLELIFRKGLQQPVLSLVQRDYWHGLETLLQNDLCGRLGSVSLAVEQTINCKKLLTAQGRGRYFLRLAVNRRILGNVVKHMLHTPKILEFYSTTISILRNEDILEPFMSLLLVISEMEFKLNIENCSFLDESWLLPVCELYEAVPCRELGMVLRYLNGRVFVLDLLQGSQAEVDGFVQLGDIIDEINGTSLRNASNGQAGVILSRLKGQPLSLRLLRCRDPDGAVFRPLVKTLRLLQQENPAVRLDSSHLNRRHGTNPRKLDQSQCLREGSRIVYIVQFLGKANIGMYGGKEVLQYGIPFVLERSDSRKEVLLDMKETHLTCTEKNTKLELFQHHYPEISCVGRFSRPDYRIFAFCVADVPDSPTATGFCCVVLQAASAQECEDIVSRVAAGFKHTEWSV